MDLSNSWEKADFSKQLLIASDQIESMKAGNVPPVFASLINLFKKYIPSNQKYKFLDCACASGYYFDAIRLLLDHEVHYTGSDLAPSAIDIARARHPQIDWHVASIARLPFDDASFDIVMASGVLEHVPAWKDGIYELARVARQYVIMHRLPISPTGAFQDGKMEMYGIPTVRHIFSFFEIIDMMKNKDFVLINSLDTYQTNQLPEQTILFKKWSDKQ
jgi:ubiquinone/menaquinone biosynthesis C-methylase UbiE